MANSVGHPSHAWQAPLSWAAGIGGVPRLHTRQYHEALGRAVVIHGSGLEALALIVERCGAAGGVENTRKRQRHQGITWPKGPYRAFEDGAIRKGCQIGRGRIRIGRRMNGR
jgi:hypothetical protein